MTFEFKSGAELLDAYLSTLGLTTTQIEQRKTGIGGSSAKDLWDGNWTKLYNQIVNGEQEDLSRQFNVQLGHVTEYFNIIWYAAEQGWDVSFPKDSIVHPNFTYIRCLPDAIGRNDQGEFVIDGKHTGANTPWWNEQNLLDYYYWQAQHNMLAVGFGRFVLTPIWGNQKSDPIWIDATPDHQEEYLDRARSFWWHVENQEPPVDPAGGEEVSISFDDMRTVDMQGNNAWATMAGSYVEHEANAKSFEEAKKGLKDLVPADARLAHGYGIEIKRNKRGALTIKQMEAQHDAA